MADMTREEAQKWALLKIAELEKNPKYDKVQKYALFFQARRSDTYKSERLKLATSHLDEAYPNPRKDQLSSNVRIWALMNNYLTAESLEKCKECGENYAILAYTKSTKSIGFSDYCSRKCSQKGLGKRQKSQEFIQKKKATAIKNYGSEKAAYIDTMTETVKERYGVDNISQIDDIKQKKIETSRERYGTDFPWQTEEGKLSQKAGIRMKHGVDNVSKIPEVKAKKIETTKKHYGVENPFQADEVKEKIKETNLKQFGVENPAQREEQKEQMRQIVNEHIAKSDYSKSNPLMYSKKACNIIQQFNDIWGYNFQHAENGGEYQIPGLGFYVDGYDATRNIVIEIDEKYHFQNGQLRQKDKQRQEEIQNILNCKFIRIKYF